jgi:hypothetical protein
VEMHRDDFDALMTGTSKVEQWRRSEHAAAVAAELMALVGGSVPMSDLLWLGAESTQPIPWYAGRAIDPQEAAMQVFERWRRLEDRRIERRRTQPDTH